MLNLFQANSCRNILLSASIFLIGSNGSVSAQDRAIARNTVYIEGATRGPVYSINYDRIFRQGEKLAYSFRAGFSIYSNTVSFPVGINFITGQHKHHAEFSFTVVPYVDYDVHLIGSNHAESDKYIFVNPAIGYRYQKAGGGLFFKAAIGPSVFLDPPSNDFWNMDPKLYAFGSIGLGISF
ncbi:MAG: hypothetical protein ABI675_00360 [Chitinophagaceae bacterium]